MAAPKNHAKKGGRKKGVPNKVTSDIREGFKLLVEGNLPNLQKWLDAAAKRSPVRALEMMAVFAEYCIPKLSRTEVTGDKDAPIVWREEKNYAPDNKTD